jgi:hypothetical protein
MQSVLLLLLLCRLVVAGSLEVESQHELHSTLRYSCRYWVQQALAAATSPQQNASDACLVTHGRKYLESWRAETLDLCQGNSSLSSALCHIQPTAALTACVARNSHISISNIQKEEPRDDEPAKFDKDDILSSSASLSLTCAPPTHSEGLPSIPSTIFHKERVLYTSNASDAAQSCSGSDPARVVKHPVLFVSRLDTTNSYHHTEFLVTAFAALASISVTPRAVAAGFQVSPT